MNESNVTSFNRTANNLVAMVTMEHKQFIHTLLSKAHLTNLNLNNFEMIEAMGIKIIE
jgi:hypothetical protein